MSVIRHRQIVCPHCGDEKERRVAQSIHAPRVPEIVAAIEARTFQRFDCGVCGGAIDVAHPMTYVDFDRYHWVVLYPEAWLDRVEVMEQNTRSSFQDAMVRYAAPVMQEIAPRFTVRTVFGLDALADKVIALRRGLDDVAVEVFKLDMLRRGDILPEPPPILIAADDETLELRVFVAGDDGAPQPTRATFSRDALAALDDPSWAAARAAVLGDSWVDVRRAFGARSHTAVGP